jgi:hypothetical protein
LATAGVAVRQSRAVIGLLIVGFNLLLCSSASWLSVRKLNHPSSFHIPLLARIKLPFRKPLFWFYLGFIMNDALLILVITKLFSYFALFGFFQIPLDHYENRIPLMGLLIGMAAHAVLVYEIRKWEDSYLSFAKNLPMTLSARYLLLVILYAIVITPEMFLLATNHVHLVDGVLTIVFGISLLLFFHAMLYPVNMDMDRYIQYVLITFLLGFALILFKLSLLLVLVCFTLSSSWYRRYFYTFEAMRL